MSYFYQKREEFKPNKKSRPCGYCENSLKDKAFRLSTTVFEDGEIYSSYYNSCVPCDLKRQEMESWIEERRRNAMEGNCPTMEKEMHSWSDGSISGGKCQIQCHNCEAMCTWGEVGSF